jgi:hypothetical protein
MFWTPSPKPRSNFGKIRFLPVSYSKHWNPTGKVYETKHRILTALGLASTAFAAAEVRQARV